jgi:hypothetical protein
MPSNVDTVVLSQLMQLAFNQSVVSKLFQQLPVKIHPIHPVPPVWLREPPIVPQASLVVVFPLVLAPRFAIHEGRSTRSIATASVRPSDAMQLPIMGLGDPVERGSGVLVHAIDGIPMAHREGRRDVVPEHCLSLAHPGKWSMVQIQLFWACYINSIKTGLAKPEPNHLIGRRNKVNQFEVGRVMYSGDGHYVDVDVVIRSINTPDSTAIWDLRDCSPLIPAVSDIEHAEQGLKAMLIDISEGLTLFSPVERIEIEPTQVEFIQGCIDGFRLFFSLSIGEWNAYFWDQWDDRRLSETGTALTLDIELREKAKAERHRAAAVGIAAGVDSYTKAANGLVNMFGEISNSFSAWSAGITPETLQAVQSSMGGGRAALAATNHLNSGSTRSDGSSSGTHYPYVASDGTIILGGGSTTSTAEEQ